MELRDGGAGKVPEAQLRRLNMGSSRWGETIGEASCCREHRSVGKSKAIRVDIYFLFPMSMWPC